MNMRDEGVELHQITGEESVVAARGLPPEHLSSGSAEPTAAEHVLGVFTLVEQCRREIQAYRYEEPSDEASSLELLRRAMVQGDQEARAALQHCLSELVQGWLYSHPRREAALSFQGEESYVALAFERFWQATVRQQVAFTTLPGVLAYLRASLQGAILDMLRTHSRPGEVSLPELHGEDRAASLRAWEALQSMLPNAREQRLAYLLYHCGLGPREIVRFCPEEWSDLQEIYQLRRSILERVRRNADHPLWSGCLREGLGRPMNEREDDAMQVSLASRPT